MSCAPDCGCGTASCCEGSDVLVPEAKDNAPGQSVLHYRVGTYASFFETMLARLTTPPSPAAVCDPDAEQEPDPLGMEGDGSPRWPLRELTTRDSGDPTIALLDAWAMVGDVLTFYQERIANEGYLRTATELRSVEELARLVGYRPRPGVAASVDLAFTLDVGQMAEIPAGTRAQSLPRPGRLPQAYETMALLHATADRNAMRPLQARFSQPRVIEGPALSTDLAHTELLIVVAGGSTLEVYVEVYLEGLSTNLKLNDVMIVLEQERSPTWKDVYRVDSIEPQTQTQRTRVLLRTYSDQVRPSFSSDDPGTGNIAVVELLEVFDRRPKDTEGKRALELTDRQLLALVGGDRVLRESLRQALESLGASQVAPTKVHAFRASSPLFGYNAAAGYFSTNGVFIRWPATEMVDEGNDRLFLDMATDRVRPGSFVVIDRGSSPDGGSPEVSVERVDRASVVPRTAYGISKTTLELALDSEWNSWQPIPGGGGEFPEPDLADLTPLRRTMVHAESELLKVARVPLGPLEGSVIELAGLHFDLEPGHVLIVEGEDAATPGPRQAERAIVSSVVHVLPEVSTRITLTNALGRAYIRATTIIHGNVAPATQGESRTEVLGSGDASKASQEFTLRHKPLTHVPAATVDGVASTLTVRVGGVAWPQAALRPLLGPRDRNVLTHLDAQGRTVVIGGDGWHGARFPTGLENITAEYRSGQGADGNTDPDTITNLATRPFGVQKVTNPIAASGGADPDGIEATRLRAPLAGQSLDRLLSVQDHEDFALRFAGIAKARAHRQGSDGVHARWRVRTVVAGNAAVALQPDSALLLRLRQTMRRFGDPSLEREIVPARLEPLSINARIAVAHGYAFHEVEPRVRAALVESLGYDVQGIGRAIHPSRIVGIVQAVPGVDFVDLEHIGALGLTDLDPLETTDKDEVLPGAEPPSNPEREGVDQTIRPDADTVLFVDAARPETLDLTEWTP
jgi:hypothetical protein